MSRVIKLAVKIEQERNDYRKVLQEFIGDIEAHGETETKEYWPDLYITYQHAKEALRAVQS